MNNFEFISYTPTPTDAYMLGVVKVKAFGKIELRYKHVKTKDGSATFFTCANYTTQDPNTQEKRYTPCFLLDSRSDEEMLMDLIRDGVQQVMAQRSAHSAQPTAPAAIHYPHGMAQQSHQQHATDAARYIAGPTSMREVAADEQLPF